MLTSAVESGISTFLFPAEHQHFAQDWKGIVAFDALVYDGDAIRSDSHQVRGSRGCSCSKLLLPDFTDTLMQFDTGWTDPPSCVRFGYASSSQGLQ